MDDATATLRGLTTGAGTPYRWSTWPQGLLGTADIRVFDVARPRRNGVTPGDDLTGGKTVIQEIVIGGPRAVAEAAVAELTAAYAPASTDEWFDVRLTGEPSEYSLLGRARGCQVVLPRQFVSGEIHARCVFVATEPILYGPEESVSIQLGLGGAGLVFPATFPVVFGGGAGTGIGSAPNSGPAAVDWVATLTGPLTNPRLEHVESGRFVKIAATLADGETLVLDSSSGGLLLGGTTPRPTWFSPGSRWFQLSPGPNSIRLTADSGLGSALITWRPGWA